MEDETSWDKLRLPDKFANVLVGREVTLREAGGGRRAWDVEVVFDGEGHMYLERGWEQFARAHDLQPGHFLVFSYDGDAVLAVKVLDGSMFTVSKGSSSEEMDIHDAPASQFTVMLRQCQLRLPAKFVEVLSREPREVKLREAGGGRRLWMVEVVLDGDGHTHLGRGWEQFARAHDLQLGHFLVFSYNGDAVLTVKVFDGNMCRRHYQHDDDDASTTPPAPGKKISSKFPGISRNFV